MKTRTGAAVSYSKLCHFVQCFITAMKVTEIEISRKSILLWRTCPCCVLEECWRPCNFGDRMLSSEFKSDSSLEDSCAESEVSGRGLGSRSIKNKSWINNWARYYSFDPLAKHLPVSEVKLRVMSHFLVEEFLKNRNIESVA